MKLSVSNIAWEAAQDARVYRRMGELGFTGLEIAPTRIFPEQPYDRLEAAGEWSRRLRETYGLTVVSLQSIWYGRQEKLFGTEEERRSLLDYTKKAIDFAEAVGCGNLVFGCPRNRVMPESADPEIGILFFRELGEYAAAHGTVLSMEANPPIYHTNYINDTSSALELVRRVGSPGFLVNLDVGTMVENGEEPGILKGRVREINHVHLSEPGLPPPRERPLHKALFRLLEQEGYPGFFSLEMGRQEDLSRLFDGMEYLRSLSNDHF